MTELFLPSLLPPSSPAGLAVVEELVAEDAPGEIRRLRSTASFSSTDSAGSDSGDSSSSGASAAAPGGSARRLSRVAVAVARATLFLLARLLLSAITPLLVLLLRRLVRTRAFWERGLASAWHDGRRVTAEYVDNYR